MNVVQNILGKKRIGRCSGKNKESEEELLELENYYKKLAQRGKEQNLPHPNSYEDYNSMAEGIRKICLNKKR